MAERPLDGHTTSVPVDSWKAKHGPDWLDRTWDFLSSVSVATVLIFLLASASVAGSLIEQEGMYQSYLPPSEFYPLRYGPIMGPLLMRLGLTHAYTSWWFLSLMGLVGASLIVCSIQRGVPLYKSLHRPPIAPKRGFLRHLEFRLTANRDVDSLSPMAGPAAGLKRLGYNVHIAGDRLLADKGRWGRWGPYIIHMGLILILLGALMRVVPGWYSETTVWIKDGEIVRIPFGDWFLQSEHFTVEYYESGQPKSYATAAVVIENGEEVKRHTIKMNEPLQHRGIEVYQSSYNTTLGTADVTLMEKVGETGVQEVGRFTVDLHQPAKSYQAGSVSVQLVEYFPDFTIDDRGQPATRSADPINPALLLRVPDHENPIWFFARFPEMQFDPMAPYQFGVANMTSRNATGLRVKQDYGLNMIWAGLSVLSLGTLLAFYLSHRRVWAMVDGDRILVSGQTNRDRMGFARELRILASRLPGAELEQMGGVTP